MISKNAIKLAIFAVITSGITSIINYITKPVIEHQISIRHKNLLDQIIPPVLYNNNIQQECYLIKNKNILGDEKLHHLYVARKDKLPVAAVLDTIAPDGYAGNIHILVATYFYGKILGIRVLKHNETPGLGDKIDLRVSQWIKIFNGKIVQNNDDNNFALKKDGGDIDQFTGATITPRAVVNATKRTVLFIKTLSKKINFLPKCENKDINFNETKR